MATSPFLRCRDVQQQGTGQSHAVALEALWPGVIVTEGSLQRVVSLARAAFHTGDWPGAVAAFPVVDARKSLHAPDLDRCQKLRRSLDV